LKNPKVVQKRDKATTDAAKQIMTLIFRPPCVIEPLLKDPHSSIQAMEYKAEQFRNRYKQREQDFFINILP